MSEEKKFDPNNPCLFCKPKSKEVIAETDLAVLVTDTYPVVCVGLYLKIHNINIRQIKSNQSFTFNRYLVDTRAVLNALMPSFAGQQ